VVLARPFCIIVAEGWLPARRVLDLREARAHPVAISSVPGIGESSHEYERVRDREERHLLYRSQLRVARIRAQVGEALRSAAERASALVEIGDTLQDDLLSIRQGAAQREVDEVHRSRPLRSSETIHGGDDPIGHRGERASLLGGEKGEGLIVRRGIASACTERCEERRLKREPRRAGGSQRGNEVTTRLHWVFHGTLLDGGLS
jgi:hypothetical protein